MSYPVQRGGHSLSTCSISVVLPAYNEAERIQENLIEVVRTLKTFCDNFEVLVVDDGSSDGTGLLAASVAASRPCIKVLHYEQNQGKGHAVVLGAMHACGDYIVLLDADLDLHPKQIREYMQLLHDQQADAIVGSKNHPESVVQGYPAMRKLYSLAYYLVVRLLFGLPLRDTQTGLKIFKREVLQAVVPRILAKRFAFDIEILANVHRRGYAIAEAPVALTFQRRMGRINWKDCVQVARDTAAIFYRMFILRHYDKPVEGTMILPTAMRTEVFASVSQEA
jgi:glycosyltransferase involved in cell wall biosynthesis